MSSNICLVVSVLQAECVPVVTWGWVAGEVMLGDLFRSGFDIVDDHEDADAIVVNTCSFVEEAKTESLEVHAKLQ